MNKTKYNLIGWLLFLPWLFACSENDAVGNESNRSVQVTLDVCVPAPAISRAVSNEVEADKCALLAFQEDKLLWMLKSGSQMYLAGNKLYLTVGEIQGAVDLIMLANVAEMDSLPDLQERTEKSIVIEALKGISYDCSTLSEGSIPMAGETTLPDGLTDGTSGVIKLRRSLAKISMTVTYDEGVEERFKPDRIKIVNTNASTAIYAEEGDSNIVQYGSVDTTEIEFDENGYAEAFVAETTNTKTKGSRIAILLGGTYKGPDVPADAQNAYCWYRLDMIRDNGEGNEIDALLRNKHYRFVVRNLTFGGSATEEGALDKISPDNMYLIQDDSEDFFEILDEEIYSITTEYYNKDNPYYIGVSATSATMNIGLNDRAVVRVEVLTNHDNLAVDESYCQGLFTFVTEKNILADSTTVEGTLWIWENEGVTEVGTYTYYITCGSVRKAMSITVVNKGRNE